MKQNVKVATLPIVNTLPKNKPIVRHTFTRKEQLPYLYLFFPKTNLIVIHFKYQNVLLDANTQFVQNVS